MPHIYIYHSYGYKSVPYLFLMLKHIVLFILPLLSMMLCRNSHLLGNPLVVV